MLSRRVIPQPQPFIFPQGDCGACVLGGALDLTVEKVYDDLKGERRCIGRGEMARILRVASSCGLVDRLIEAPAEWPRYRYVLEPFGSPPHTQSLEWFNYVRMAIDAGYYGLAEVALHAENKHLGSDHWVLICGARTDGCVTGQTLTGEVLVSCSATSTPAEEWVEARDFLTNRGGFNLLFVRPT